MDRFYEVRCHLAGNPEITVNVQNLRASSSDEAIAMTKRHMKDLVPVVVTEQRERRKRRGNRRIYRGA